MRSNNPFGEVGSASLPKYKWQQPGTSDYPGYSGVVFELIDAYKGDFARNYFYMATRYKDVIFQQLEQPDAGDDSYPVFTEWAASMLIEWHTEDPVSQKGD